MDLTLPPVLKLFSDQARLLTQALAQEMSFDSTDWWISELMPSATALEEIPLSHSPFGVAISMESGRPNRIRTAVQPGPLAPSGQLEEVLARRGRAGEEAIAALHLLGPECNGRLRGNWEIAVGDGTAGVRLYVFHPNRSSIASHMRYLRSVGLWPEALDSSACDLIEALMHTTIPTAVARSFGARPGYKLYLNSVVPLALWSIELAAAGQSDRAIGDVRRFCAQVIEACGECPFHGWSISVDDAGRLIDWKLELFAPGLGSSGVIDRWPGFREFRESGRSAAAIAGICARTDLISIRIREDGPDYVLYMSFEPNGYEYILRAA